MASDPLYRNSTHRNVHYISLSFFLVFSGVNSALVFGTSDYGDYAATSLAILYSSFALSALFIVPYILNNNLLSAKYCAFFGSLVEILFISQYIIFINAYYLYFASIIQGIGVSMYWIGSQQFIVQCANHYEHTHHLQRNSHIGTLQGIYFTFYESSTFASNILSAILFALKLSNSMVYTAFTIICCFGCGITLFADDIKPRKDNAQHSSLSTLQMWSTPQLQCLMAMSVYFGIYQQFEYGIFPTFIEDKSMMFFVMACYGLSGAIFSKYFTKIWNQINAYCIISSGIVINILIFAFVLNIGMEGMRTIHPIYLFAIALLNGCVEASFFVTLFILYPVICGDKPEALANAQFFQQIGLAIGYVMYSVFEFEMKIIVGCVALAVAVFMFYKSSIVREYMNANVKNERAALCDDADAMQYMSIVIVSNKVKQHYMMYHDAESDGYESTYSEIEDN
eukprot:183297_1